MVGYKFGPFRVQAGPVGHAFVSSTSELKELADYDAAFDKLTFGYQAGAGLDLGRFLFDVKYQGGLSHVGDHLRFGEQEVRFAERPGRLVLGVGFSFN